MLSDVWPLFRGIGYSFDSVIIRVIPIPKSPTSDNPLYILIERPDPDDPNKEIEIAQVLENNRVADLSICAPELKFSYGMKKGKTILSKIKEWELSQEGCGKTGVGWKYRHYKGLRESRRFSPEKHAHTCRFIALEEMSGLRVTITQILRCKTKGWANYIPFAKSKFKKLCPTMDHTLELCFNNLDNFNRNLNIENSKKCVTSNVIFSRNSLPRVSQPSISKFENFEIKSSFSILT